MITNSINKPDDVQLLIRAMDISDLDPVLEIENLSFSSPWPKSAYLYELEENQKSKLWVAEINSKTTEHKVVGVIVIWSIVDEVHIATLAVHPEFRRLGIAKQLISIVIKDAYSQGAGEVTLEVRESNTAAQELYHLFDFSIVGHRRHYYRNNKEDALIMTVKL